MCSMHMSAADSTYVAAVDSFKMVDSTKVVAVQESKYEKHLDRRARAWASLIPTHFVIQNAGNMGVISLGVGWSYGKNRKWETELLFGYIPRHDSSRGKLTTTQPSRYPDKYYEFMSTKFRLNLALGQRITLKIPENKRKLHNRISLFYEIGTCDLYIRSLFQGQDVKIGDILGLSIGMKFYMK